jgi:hypothetical protein
MMIAGCDGAYEKRNSFMKLAKTLGGYHDAIACNDETACDAALRNLPAQLRLPTEDEILNSSPVPSQAAG